MVSRSLVGYFHQTFGEIGETHNSFKIIHSIWASLVSQMVKNLPAMQETQVQSLGQKDPLEKEMATQSSILAWRIPWTQDPVGLRSMESQRLRHD